MNNTFCLDLYKRLKITLQKLEDYSGLQKQGLIAAVPHVLLLPHRPAPLPGTRITCALLELPDTGLYKKFSARLGEKFSPNTASPNTASPAGHARLVFNT